MASRRALLGFAAVLAASLSIAPVAQAAQSKEAETFIGNLANEALKDLSDKLPEPELEKRFKALLDKNFDMARISRFVLGRYWVTASDKEKQDFQNLFEAYVVRAYSIRFSEYSGETVKVTGSRSDTPDNAVVMSDILQPDNAPPVKVEWVLRKSDNAFRIADVSVDGVSMVLTQKQEFAAVIERNGGGVASLNRAIQDKLNGTTTAQQSRGARSSPGQGLVADTVWLVGLGAEAALPIGLVVLVVALEPHDLAVALEGEDVGRDAVEEPAVVADHHDTAWKVHDRILERAERIDVEIVGGLVQQDHVGAGLEHLREVNAVALSARELPDFFLRVGAAEVEQRDIGSARHLAPAEVDLVLTA